MSETNDRKKRPWRWVLFGLPLLLVLGFVGFRVAGNSQVEKEVEAIRKRGLPTSAVELDDWYQRVPASENAALVFLDAAALHRAPATKPSKDPNNLHFRAGESMTPELIAAIEPYVSANGGALAEMNKAAGLRKSRYPVDTTKGAGTLVPHLAPLKQLAQLSRWAAIQKAREGKTDEAVQILKNGFDMAASLEPEPILISELVRISIVTILAVGMEQALFENDFTGAQLGKLAEMVTAAEAHGTNAISRIMVGERAFGMTHMDLSYKQFSQYGNWGGGTQNFNSFEEMAKAALFGARRVLGMHARDKLFYLETMGEGERAAQLDYPEMLRESERIFEAATEQMQAHPIRYLISRQMLVSMGSYAKKEVFLAARLRCARTALAIQMYRAKHDGKLPNLSELTPEFLPEIPRDPADNQPLEYRAGKDKGYKIIAVTSTDMTNEGRKPTNRLDIGFTVAR